MILVFLYLKYKSQCVKLIEEHWGDRELQLISLSQSISTHYGKQFSPKQDSVVAYWSLFH